VKIDEAATFPKGVKLSRAFGRSLFRHLNSFRRKFRKRVEEIYAEIHESVVYCLKAAVKAGELPATADCKELSLFIPARRYPAGQSRAKPSAIEAVRQVRLLHDSSLAVAIVGATSC